ncbi:hypothetical protein PoB_005186900 [Plakobranchus ocellatus]|uniref:Uncharacterized protein n=1 Tax=Plakobranchus ocellatus TaxID=259542 RepID=A0AAV4C3V1_9GAST|nr:hypothetical protein PoB_005186900 [Plakobranchus ocellatus]
MEVLGHRRPSQIKYLKENQQSTQQKQQEQKQHTSNNDNISNKIDQGQHTSIDNDYTNTCNNTNDIRSTSATATAKAVTYHPQRRHSSNTSATTHSLQHTNNNDIDNNTQTANTDNTPTITATAHQQQR